MTQLLESSEIRSKADLARHLGISRARVTQTLNLLRLAPDIQKYILALPNKEAAFCTERRLRPLTQVKSRQAQLAAFRELVWRSHRRDTRRTSLSIDWSVQTLRR